MKNQKILITCQINSILNPLDVVITNYGTKLLKTNNPNEYVILDDIFYDKGYITILSEHNQPLIDVSEGITYDCSTKFYYEKGIYNKELPVVNKQLLIDKNSKITIVDFLNIVFYEELHLGEKIKINSYNIKLV